MAMTKQTIVQWPLDQGIIQPAEHITAVVAKIEEMQTAGKTDGILFHNTENTTEYEIRRDWLDQAAADEWLTWLLDSTQSHTTEPPKSTTVIDLPA